MSLQLWIYLGLVSQVIQQATRSTHVLGYQTGYQHKAALSSCQDTRVTQNVTIHQSSRQAEIFCARSIHLAHYSLRYFAINLVEEGLAPLQYLRCRHIINLYRAGGWRETQRFIHKTSWSCVLQREESIDSLIISAPAIYNFKYPALYLRQASYNCRLDECFSKSSRDT